MTDHGGRDAHPRPDLRRSAWRWAPLLLLLCAPLAEPAAEDCQPCGAWRLESGSQEQAEAAVEAALARYEPPRLRRRRVPAGDIEAATRAEFEHSLGPPGTLEDIEDLRNDLRRATRVPAELELRLEGATIVIVADGMTTRLRPGTPHSRVDALGTANISTRLRGSTLTYREHYDRRNDNRVEYRVDQRTRRLTVTRTVERRGLPELKVQSTYAPR